MLAGFLTASVQAAGAVSPLPQPTVDLGETSFLDGEAGSGGLLEVIGNGYTANYVTDSRGNAVPGTNNEASTSPSMDRRQYESARDKLPVGAQRSSSIRSPKSAGERVGKLAEVSRAALVMPPRAQTRTCRRAASVRN